MEIDSPVDTCASDKLLTQEAITEMRAKLPEYVVNCFEAAGYDTLAIIADADVSNKPGNSIEEIEKFISETYPNNPKFCRDIAAPSPFRFPPGHRKRICNFVQEVRAAQKTKKTRLSRNKRPIEHVVGSKSKVDKRSKPGVAKEVIICDKSDHHFNPVDLFGKIRRQIASWQRSQADHKVKELKEYEHFEILVSDENKVSFTCKMCGSKSSLGFKDGKCILSNLTRHITKCIGNPKCPKYTENRMFKYLSGSTSSSKATATLRSSSETAKSSIEKQPQDQLTEDTTTVAKSSAQQVIIIPDTEPKSSEKVILQHNPPGNGHATAIVSDPVESVVGETLPQLSNQPNEDSHPFRITPPVNKK